MKSEESHIIFHRSGFISIYLDVLKASLQTITTAKDDNLHLIIPFVLTSAAALESLLNDRIINQSFLRYGLDDYFKYASGLLALPLSSKLDYVVPFLSRDKFGLRTDSKVYLEMRKLIRLRNSLMHDKSFFKAHHAKERKEPDGSTVIVVPDSAYKSEILDKLKTKQCQAFYESLIELRDTLQSKTKWKANHILKAFPYN